MRTNEALGNLVRGRTIEVVTKEEGPVTIVFDDRSKLEIKVFGAPDANQVGKGLGHRMQ